MLNSPFLATFQGKELVVILTPCFLFFLLLRLSVQANGFLFIHYFTVY